MHSVTERQTDRRMDDMMTTIADLTVKGVKTGSTAHDMYTDLILRFNKLRFRFALSLCAFHFALLSKKRFISIFVSSYETAV